MEWTGSIVFLGTKNLKKVNEFYGEILGLNLYKDQGSCLIFEVPGGGKIGFCNHLELEQGKRGPIITLLSSDVDGAFNQLKKEELEIEKEPAKNPDFNIYHFFVRDFDGYLVEIQKFLDQDE
ncbi:MAG: VOC family protein [Halanaerobiales bacterium]